MANTDPSLVEAICNNINIYRRHHLPSISKMDFYYNCTESYDVAVNVDNGTSMPSFSFLAELSIHEQKPVDYFVNSGFLSLENFSSITEKIHPLEIHEKYIFVQKINLLKYEIFTNVDSSNLEIISYNETSKSLRGKILKNAQTKHGLSDKELSERIKRAPSTVDRMKKGGGESSPYIWAKIAHEFKIPFDFFIFDLVKNNPCSVEVVLDYFIYDTFSDLNSNQKNILIKLMDEYIKFYNKE